MMSATTSIRIVIEGHTDDRGTDPHNNKLSTDRASSVRSYLVKSGISADRLDAKGYGKTKPIEKGVSDAARQRNRRVEFRITAM
jgi:outer membrane protein OmpA-like peptidoglycan-associated protein